MIINTKYNLGEQVYVKLYRGIELEYCKGEIKTIFIYGSCENVSIRYRMIIPYKGTIIEQDRWEDDLVREDLTGSAMPKLLIIQIDKTEETQEVANKDAFYGEALND